MNNYSYIEETSELHLNSAVSESELVYEDQVKAALATLIDEDAAAGMAESFQALADPTRLKIISALIKTEMRVCDLAAVLGMTQSAVSHQLRLLRNLKLVKPRKMGRVVYYSLDDDHIQHLYQLGLEHYNHHHGR